ncbi:MAG: 50S ribosomal protein L10 [Planctomycetia bacterium]|nr:50S ribosomal protein L10 [Planctomycetia bacterium]MBL6915040.1 50S ribosomal protein L10 [Planctomycetota bacterium]HCW45285.1 50S ribosomal protein L10 [Planctomycetota bacterium]
MARRLKVMMTKQLSTHLDDSEDLLLVDFSGLSSSEDFGARTKLREAGLSVNVVKNSLLKRVLTERGTEFPDATFSGPLALINGEADAITASKAVAGMRKELGKKLLIKGGVLEGSVLGPDDAEKLTKMPSVQETQAAVVSAIAGPLTGLVAITQNLLTGIPGVVQAIADKRKEEGE